MLINTNTALAVRCPMCGKLDTRQLSLFDFSGAKPIQIKCQCGFTKAIIGSKRHKQYWLKVPCLLCETEHVFYYSLPEFFAPKVHNIYCAESDIKFGCLGPAELVEQASQNNDELRQFIHEIGFDDYFENPQVMLESLNYLHDIAEEDGISCACGNIQIDIDIYADKIKLWCQNCGCSRYIMARNENDLKELKKIGKIEMKKYLTGVASPKDRGE